jgi:CubicO group peptidase (beta-lactamase class C family)
MNGRQALLFIALLAACSSSEGSSTTPDAGTPAAPGPVDAGAPEDAAPPNALATSIDALFAAAEAKDTFAGTVVVVDGGKTVMVKGYGAADRKTGRKNAEDTIFRIGSITKQFTASAVLALYDDGKLSVNDPVSKYIPEYPKENLTKDGVEVTLHHLLSQSSGMPDGRSTSYFKDNAWLRPIDKQKELEAAMVLPLARKPGEAFEYNNYNYFVLGLVVERVSGKAWDAFLRERFFDPLGMKDTGAFLPAASAPRAAVGYYDSGGKRIAFADNVGFGDPDVTLAFGSGQIHSTVLDLAKWDRALASGAVLKLGSRTLLFSPNLGSYGYGWVIEQKSNVTIEWHNGALSPLGFSALIVRVPSKDRCVAFASNLDYSLTDPLVAKVEALAVK